MAIFDSIVVAMLLIISAKSEIEFKDDLGKSSAVVNDFVDRLLKNLKPILIQKGFDPLKIQPYDATFEYRIGLIVFIGQLRLDNATLHHLSQVQRKGDVIFNYENRTFEAQIDLQFQELKMISNYTVKVINIGKIGKMLATIRNLTISLDVDFNLENYKAHLKDLKIKNEGWIDVDLKGNILDDLGGIIIETIANVFKSRILRNLEIEAKKEIEEALQNLHF